jgi:hypothetical protein
LEKEDTCPVHYFILVAGGQLLKYIQVPELQTGVLAEKIIKTGEKTVLVKIIIHDLVAEIDHQFIIQYKSKWPFLVSFFGYGYLEEKIIPEPVIKIISIRQFISIFNLATPSFFQPDPLHHPDPGVVGMPLNLNNQAIPAPRIPFDWPSGPAYFVRKRQQ